ncbi:MAG: SUMF1/EgtB/PvdO family nonheme iron enzyme [Bacteroidota bacterium]|nr:SUMF1/EgtB/PvdO family nonheme iron enzyme [Bacteroidota bacterium]
MKFAKRVLIVLLSIFVFVAIKLEVVAQKAPPGTVAFSDNLYVDKQEIRNVDWREYMYWHLKKFGSQSEEYIETLPDTLVWDNEMKKLYLRHPNYANHPVVGISYHQAKAYCKWRTKVVNIFIFRRETKQTFNADSTYEDIPQVFVYRLPTIEEWEDISRIPLRKYYIRKIEKKGYPRGNFKPKDRINMSKVKTKPVDFGFKNKGGVYNLFGNVAEITSKRGVAKGGSWQHFDEQCIPESGFSYSGTESWLGFRCVCEKVLTEKKEEVPAKPEALELE